MDQNSAIRLGLAIGVAVVGLAGAAHLQPWYISQAFTLMASIGTVISVALLANWFTSARATSSDACPGSEAVRSGTRPLFLLTLAAAILSVMLTATIPRAQEARESARQEFIQAISSLPPDAEVRVQYRVPTETYIELPLLGVSIILLLTAANRRRAVPIAFLLIGFILLAIPVVIGIAAVPWEPETDLLYYLPPCLRILGWIAIAWYSFCLARSTQTGVDQSERPSSANQPGG